MKNYSFITKIALSFLLFFTTTSLLFAQVGIGTTSPNANLEVVATGTNDGIIIPRVTTLPALAAAQHSALVYLTATVGVNTPGFYYWNDTDSTWYPLLTSEKGWTVIGNSGTVAGTNFLGTTDTQDLRIHTDDTERMRVTATGEVAINETVIFPGDQFTVTGTLWPINAYGLGTSATTPLHAALYGQQDGIGTVGFLQHNGTSGTGIQLQMLNAANASDGVTILHDGPATAITAQTRSNTITGVINVADFSYSGTDVDDHVAVYGQSIPAAGWGYGVIGEGNWYGVFSDGDSGASGGKFFTIDHPADPANKILRHASVESNEILNLYRGTAVFDANGKVTVEMPDYYDAINKNASYQLTPIGAAMPNLFIEKEVENQQFVIAGGVAGKKVSWTLTAERNDPYLQQNPEKREMVLEKEGSRAGKYFTPELYNQPEEKGMFYRKGKDGKREMQSKTEKKE